MKLKESRGSYQVLLISWVEMANSVSSGWSVVTWTRSSYSMTVSVLSSSCLIDPFIEFFWLPLQDGCLIHSPATIALIDIKSKDYSSRQGCSRFGNISEFALLDKIKFSVPSPAVRSLYCTPTSQTQSFYQSEWTSVVVSFTGTPYCRLIILGVVGSVHISVCTDRVGVDANEC